jgi:hypothetical protein
MARRHQMKQCLEYSSHDVLRSQPFSMTTTKSLQMSCLPAELRSAIAVRLQADVSASDSITVAQQLRKDHITYSVDSCFVVAVVEQEEIPVYFQIKYIVLFRDTWILCSRLCFCEQFNRHIHAFKVNVDNDWAVVHPGEEMDYNTHEFCCCRWLQLYQFQISCSCTNVPELKHSVVGFIVLGMTIH